MKRRRRKRQIRYRERTDSGRREQEEHEQTQEKNKDKNKETKNKKKKKENQKHKHWYRSSGVANEGFQTLPRSPRTHDHTQGETITADFDDYCRYVWVNEELGYWGGGDRQGRLDTPLLAVTSTAGKKQIAGITQPRRNRATETEKEKTGIGKRRCSRERSQTWMYWRSVLSGRLHKR